MTKEQKFKALVMLFDGATYKEVAEKYCVEQSYVYTMFRPILEGRERGKRAEKIKYKNLRNFIMKNYKNNEKFAKKIGVNRATVQRILNGETNPSKKTIDNMIKLSGMKYEEIFAEDWEENGTNQETN